MPASRDNSTQTLSNKTLDSTCNVSAAQGGGGTPGGSDTQVQFNDGDTFNGDAGLTYDKARQFVQINSISDTSGGDVGGLQVEIESGTTGLGVAVKAFNTVPLGATGNVSAIGVEIQVAVNSTTGGSGIVRGLAIDSISSASAVDSLIGIDISQISVAGAGSSTTAAGLNVADIHGAGSTETAAIRIQDQGAGATDFAIKTGTGQVVFGDIVKAVGYKASDGSTGQDATVDATALSTKTMTFKNGLLVDFS